MRKKSLGIFEIGNDENKVTAKENCPKKIH